MLGVIFLLVSLISVLCFSLGWELLVGALVFIVLDVLGNLHAELNQEVIYGCDLGGTGMSIGLFILSGWIIILMVCASREILTKTRTTLRVLYVVRLLLLLFVFISVDLIGFYLSFEGVLIPTYILIMGWGYQPERLQAGLYLIFYTLIASLPLLLVILNLGVGVKGSLLWQRGLISNWGWLRSFIYFAGVVAFIVRMPLFIFHLWLPRAHVEAPIAGSMLLAGVLLKIGGYGLFRVRGYFYSGIKYWGCLWLSLGLVGGIYLSLVCLRQRDVRALIAYSSVVHMGLVVAGLITLSWVGLIGSFILMVGHGLCSSGLFCLANINYISAHSRSLVLVKGMIGLIPRLRMIWFLLVSSNMAAPPSLNLLGEIALIGRVLGWGYQMVLVLIVVSFLSARYCLYLFSFTQHGAPVKLFSSSRISMIDYVLIVLHWVPLNVLFVRSELFYL